MKNSSIWRHFDLWLAAAAILLTAYGVLAIKSAVTGAPAYEIYPQRQIAFAIAGVAVMIGMAALDYRLLTSMHWYIYAIMIGLLVFVIVAGAINNDSRRWISLGFIQVQPSEFGRVLVAITFGQFLANRQQVVNRFSSTLVSLLYIAVPVGLIFIQPDLGMSILFIALWFAMIWLAGLPLLHFLALLGTSVGSFFAVYPFLKEYQQERLLAFINPEAVPEQAFNIDQALISIGSGGLWGKGYLQGTQSQLGFLRVQHTDFIFSVISEEMGLILGSLVVLGLLTFILVRILRAAALSPDPAARYICIGIAAFLFFQTVVNIGMNLRLLPVTGLTLPLVSYGGSSLITVFMAIGVVQSILMRHRTQEF